MTIRSWLLAASFALLAGCGAGTTTYVAASTPGYYAAPGVQVVTAYDGTPMYLVDDSYWMWRDGYWMSWGYGGWYWATPPYALSSYYGRWHTGWGAPGYGYGYGRGSYARNGEFRDHRDGRAGRVSGGVRTPPPTVNPPRGARSSGGFSRPGGWSRPSGGFSRPSGSFGGSRGSVRGGFSGGRRR